MDLLHIVALGRVCECGKQRVIVEAETAQHHVRCCQLDELRRGQFGEDLSNFLADAKPEHGFHLVFAHQSLREQKIGEIDLPDLLENFTAFQFFPATKKTLDRLSGAYRQMLLAGDQIVKVRVRWVRRTTKVTAPGNTVSLKRYRCYRV